MGEIRDDFEEIRRSIRPRASGLQSTMFVGRIVDRGAMPTTTGRFVAVNPVTIGGDESEGGAGSLTVDSGVDVIADWLGPGAPAAGGNVMVESVANRWVAWTSGSASTCVPCDPCCIPKRNLAMSYVNGLTGSGSAGMLWDGGKAWTSPITGTGVLFSARLECVAGRTVFSVMLYSSRAAATPAATYTSDGSEGCILASAPPQCTPFLLDYHVYNPFPGGWPNTCPALAAMGFRQFVVTL